MKRKVNLIIVIMAFSCLILSCISINNSVNKYAILLVEEDPKEDEQSAQTNSAGEGTWFFPTIQKNSVIS